MKKLLTLVLILFIFSLSACSLDENNQVEVKSNQLNQLNQKNQANQPNIADDLKVNKNISSEKLGIKVSYYSNPENETGSKIEGKRIYFYMNGPENTSDYKTGQYLEEFTKEINSDFKTALENKFLQNIKKEKCFVKIIEDTVQYQKAIIDYPDELCPNGDPAFICNSCPANYSRTNGISYFIYYKDQPNLFFYFSIGQYSLLMGSSKATSSLEWFNNIEFIK